MGGGGRGLAWSAGLTAASVTFLPRFTFCIYYLKELAASCSQLSLQGAFIWRENQSVLLEVLLVVNPKKNLRNFFQIRQFSQILLLIFLPFPLGRLP